MRNYTAKELINIELTQNDLESYYKVRKKMTIEWIIDRIYDLYHDADRIVEDYGLINDIAEEYLYKLDYLDKTEMIDNIIQIFVD